MIWAFDPTTKSINFLIDVPKDRVRDVDLYFTLESSMSKNNEFRLLLIQVGLPIDYLSLQTIFSK